MTMGVAREFAAQGIRALSISPGPIKTPFQAAAATSPELKQQFLDDVPMKRFGEPEEIGELVLFMCSDACPFMTADTVYRERRRRLALRQHHDGSDQQRGDGGRKDQRQRRAPRAALRRDNASFTIAA